MLTSTTARAGPRNTDTRRSDSGFSLIELMVAVAIFLGVTAIVTSGLQQMTNAQRTISNRTQMHSGVRSATELLQQEIGQAGRVGLATPAQLASAVAAGSQTVGIQETINGVLTPSVQSIFVGEQLAIDAGDNGTVPIAETVTVTAVSAGGNTITATFTNAHAAGAAVNAYGGFSNGIVPPQPAFANGSTGSVLKLYGDMNDDGSMQYVEYTCDTAGGNLYRNVVAFDAAAKPAVTSSQILLSNLQPNPGGTACFTYMPNPLQGDALGNTYVLDVGVTLTVQTQQRDPVTQQFQTETKALLNVSPRNVFDVYQLMTNGFTNRLQPMPATVTNLLK